MPLWTFRSGWIAGGVILCVLASYARAQDYRPLPTANLEVEAAAIAGTDASAVESTPRTGATSQFIGVDPQAPLQSLSQAEVERIIAEYLAKREAEKQLQSSSRAAMPASITTEMFADDPAKGYVVGSDKKFSASWNNGLEFQSANKDFKAHVGGRTQYDTSFFRNDEFLEQPTAAGGIGPLNDSTQFRRARLRVDGTIYEQIEYAFEYEFLNDISVANGPPQIATTVPAATDMWVNFSKLPILGNIKVGNQKTAIGLEHLQSSRYLDFIERSFNQDLFYAPFNNGFSPGILFWDNSDNKRFHWQAGFFAANMNGGTNISGYGIGNDYVYSSRLVALPYFDQEGRYMMHIGASTEFRSADDGHVRVRSRGNIRNGPPGPINAVYADTTYLLAENQNLLNLEGIVQLGSLMFQGEYCFSSINNVTQTVGVPAATPRGDVYVHGGYLECLYFLTGEHRAYSIERASFDRVIPYSNAFRVRDYRGCICNGWGAWQVGIRYDHADLNDSGINGGRLDAVTLGVNWFLNPNMKVQVNTDWTRRGSVTLFNAGAFNTVPAGDIFGLGTRLAIDF